MQWYETTQGQQRLLWENNFLQEDFPQIEVEQCEDGYIRASGVLGPSNLSPRTMFVVGEFPSNYPSTHPRVFAPHEQFPSGTPHIYPCTECELCLDHGDFTPDDTMATVFGWAIQWIAVYDSFRNTGQRW